MKTSVFILAAILLCSSPGQALAQHRSGGSHGFFGATINRIENFGRGVGRSIGRIPSHLNFGSQRHRAKPPSGIGNSRVNSAISSQGRGRRSGHSH
jgi:hypothetical protein